MNHDFVQIPDHTSWKLARPLAAGTFFFPIVLEEAEGRKFIGRLPGVAHDK
jgi:hypothetical protein